MSLPQPDLGVLRKAQRGDERAFSLIVRAYELPVFNYVLRLVGDRSLAEDLTQEVFIRVYQGLPNFSLRCRFTNPRSGRFRVPWPRIDAISWRSVRSYPAVRKRS